MNQITDTILMIRPIHFRMNEQTAVNNYYQEDIDGVSQKTLLKNAQQEFDSFVKTLETVGVHVIVVDDRIETDTPDAHFPNNWISFHESGKVAFYPMFAENRRTERREDILDILESKGFTITHVIDYSSAEDENLFLEGTGSLLLDRVHRKAYCALSPRADEELLIEFCEDFEYTPVIFTANQTVNNERLPIYHTNVMMCLGENFSVICLESIDDKKERKNVLKHLKEDGKEIIAITEKQVTHFAGNMLQLRGANNTSYLVMSSAAHQSLTKQQTDQIEKYATIVSSSLDVIEKCGGGSARCMMAEVFLPKK